MMMINNNLSSKQTYMLKFESYPHTNLVANAMTINKPAPGYLGTFSFSRDLVVLMTGFALSCADQFSSDAILQWHSCCILEVEHCPRGLVQSDLLPLLT